MRPVLTLKWEKVSIARGPVSAEVKSVMESDDFKPIGEINTRWQAAIALLRLLGLDDKRVKRVEFSAGVDELSILKVEYNVTRSPVQLESVAAESPKYYSPSPLEVGAGESGFSNGTGGA